MKNLHDKVIYVGKAKNLRARVKSYFLNNADHSLKTKFLVNQICSIEYMLTRTEVEAFLLEASLIKKMRPRYNIRLKDDKAYPYIKATVNQSFPRFYLARKVASDGALYFGPYTSGVIVRETIRFLNHTFKIRDCSESFMRARKRPCMTYQIGRCLAPCVDLISEEDYQGDFKLALQFLKGRNAQVLKDIKVRMKTAALEERFEAAAKLRDSLRAMEAVLEKQFVVSVDESHDQDVVAYYGDERGTLIETVHIRHGRMIGSRPHFISKLNIKAEGEDIRDWLTSFLNQYYLDNIIPDEIIVQGDLGIDIVKLLQAVFKERQNKVPKIIPPVGEERKKLIEIALTNAESHFKDHVSKNENRLRGLGEIQAKLHLPELPRRLECFDISNFQGDQSVASQVVFEEGLPKKEDYRRYKIKTVQGADDFASMKEVLQRRFQHTEYEDPQLVVVDGGKGQLKMAVEVLKEIGRSEVPVVGMAKARVKKGFQDKEVIESQERFFLPGRQNPVVFSKGSEALQILTGLRDEAHRFAITYHRKLREDASLGSQLDEVVGLGEKRKAQLLKKFGSVEEIRQVGVEELAALKGFNRVLAERILLQLEEE